MVSKNLPMGIRIVVPTNIIIWLAIKVREFSYTQVIVWVNTILSILILGRFTLDMEVLAWYLDPYGI